MDPSCSLASRGISSHTSEAESSAPESLKTNA